MAQIPSIAACCIRCQLRQPPKNECLGGIRTIPGCAAEIEAHALVNGYHRVLLAHETGGGRRRDQRLRIAEESTIGLGIPGPKSDTEFSPDIDVAADPPIQKRRWWEPL